MTRCCPTCGAPIVSAELTLPPIKKCILDAVRRRPGITAEQLRGIVWARDPNGGPECRHALYVHIYSLNKLLAPLGAVRAPRPCTGGYRLVAIDAARSAS